ncbi:MAG TPA: dihydroneopterin aldolase [Balneolaceae bacterium]
METLTLKGLCFHAFHGYFEEERRNGNDFEVDLTFSADFRKAGGSDKLSDTIDYQEAVAAVKSVMDGSSVKLIETLAKRIGDRLFESFPSVKELKVVVKKLHPQLDVKTAYSKICMTWQR